jgi:hypothetical protein
MEADHRGRCNSYFDAGRARAEYTQYRLTVPGGYEQFYSDKDAAERDFKVTPNAVLELASARTNGRWVKVSL